MAYRTVNCTEYPKFAISLVLGRVDVDTTRASRQNSAPCRVDTFGRSLYLPAFFMRGMGFSSSDIRGRSIEQVMDGGGEEFGAGGVGLGEFGFQCVAQG